MRYSDLSSDVLEIFAEAQGLGRPKRAHVVREYGEPRYLETKEPPFVMPTEDEARRDLAIAAAERAEAMARDDLLSPEERRKRERAWRTKWDKERRKKERALRKKFSSWDERAIWAARGYVTDRYGHPSPAEKPAA